ncbi:hypothetical protein MU582_21200 [Nocardioidaceae bacterium SCSIO 66511]|nr:hypothetical protein MU582_21200 [Nocardioidaceae bacterium SCSIO 66511]
MRAHRIVASVAAGFLLVGTLGAPVDANVRKFRDKRGDAKGSIDITKVRVDNSTKHRNKVVVRVKQRGFRSGGLVEVYLDTKPKRKGPEFRLTGYVGSEYAMRRMKSWKKPGSVVKCPGYAMKMVGKGKTRAVFKRGCIGKPGKVRVAVHTNRGNRSDWARGVFRWLGWVKR